jgi:polyvinyl alcohol dehydrogenase (cytochrome)
MPGVVFAGSMDGRLRAFDAADGHILWTFDTGGQPVPTVDGKTGQGGVLDGAGPTIAGGMVYVNSGYQGRSGTPGSVLMAFSVDGR